jgi:hypothetical protein
MPRLFLHNREIETVFQLLGEKENDVTYSVGWALYRSPSFLREFLRSTIGKDGEVGEVIVRLQHHKDPGGFTDIELELPAQFHIIAEAKRGWGLPGADQLQKYAPRFQRSAYLVRRLVVLSECSVEYATHHLECQDIQGVPVQPLPWKTIAKLAIKASTQGSHAEKRLLHELVSYLGRVTTMQSIDSNWVYVVSLASGTPEGWKISWIDIVKEKHRYFHPVGSSGWPKDPPNYVAFRYYGRLQSIHHIEAYEVFSDPHEKFPEIPSKQWDPSYLYRLGAAFAPASEVRTGNIYPSGRVWCMLDTLFTCKTISEARDKSKKREEKVESPE